MGTRWADGTHRDSRERIICGAVTRVMKLSANVGMPPCQQARHGTSQSKAGRGRAGHGRARQGKAGQGKAGQDRAGQEGREQHGTAEYADDGVVRRGGV